MPTENLPFVSADGALRNDLQLPDGLRAELARPIGPVISAHEVAGYLRGCGKIYAIGDIVTVSLLAVGIEPDIMIYDLRSQRGPCDRETILRLQQTPGVTVRVDNPPGRLTTTLWDAILKASKTRKRVKIEVKGEEDLASLACIELADIGDCVIYGIPDEGISALRIDEDVKSICRNILMRMASGR
ncbi:MAG: DUF359 domain-containing protein [Thermoplasmata archaeon]